MILSRRAKNIIFLLPSPLLETKRDCFSYQSHPCDRSRLPHTPHSFLTMQATRSTDNIGVLQIPPVVAQFARNASLVAVTIAILPLSSCILAFSYACSVLVPQNGLRRKVRSSPRFRPKTILVTGAGTAKGMRVARAFYETGHVVVGADFQPLGVPPAGRFSKALSTYYALRMPNSSSGSTLYMRDLINIIEKKNVQLWVSCSELVSSAEEGQARELVEHRTSCRTMQLDAGTVSKIKDNDEFIRFTRGIGLVRIYDPSLITLTDALVAGPRSTRRSIKSGCSSDSERGEGTQAISSETRRQRYIVRREP